MYVNKQILIGNLGQDPETYNFDNGNSITKFSIATTKKWNDKTTGETKEVTFWHNIITQNKLAETCQKYLKKGNKVYLEGETRHRAYEQDGIKKYITEVFVKEMRFLSTPQNENNAAAPNQTTSQVSKKNEEEPDDLPF